MPYFVKLKNVMNFETSLHLINFENFTNSKQIQILKILQTFFEF